MRCLDYFEYFAPMHWCMGAGGHMDSTTKKTRLRGSFYYPYLKELEFSSSLASGAMAIAAIDWSFAIWFKR